MRFILMILAGLLFFSCRNSAGSDRQEEKPAAKQPDKADSLKTFISQKWNFSAEIPEGFEISEGTLPGESPVINFYDSNIQKEPPFGIHNDASMAYITVLPHGFGVDGPGGPRKSLQEWNGEPALEFNVDPGESYAYLLENGEPWALGLRFLSPPPGWNEYGSIFVFYEVENFRGECFSSNTGEEIPMEECNALGGDAMKFYGKVSEEKRQTLNLILESIHFTDPNREREPIENLIQINKPEENAGVSSPIEISGRAKGYWFFEGSAPIKLVGEDGKMISQKYITATEEWMTEDWVPFEGRLEFETKEKRGYLIFNRANASGKPEHDRMLRIPVIFD